MAIHHPLLVKPPLVSISKYMVDGFFRLYWFWLVVWNMNSIFPSIGNVIIPTGELIFFRGVGWNHQPGIVAVGFSSDIGCLLGEVFRELRDPPYFFLPCAWQFWFYIVESFVDDIDSLTRTCGKIIEIRFIALGIPYVYVTQLWKIHYKWRFLAGKIIMGHGFHSKLLNNQRVLLLFWLWDDPNSQTPRVSGTTVPAGRSWVKGNFVIHELFFSRFQKNGWRDKYTV